MGDKNTTTNSPVLNSGAEPSATVAATLMTAESAQPAAKGTPLATCNTPAPVASALPVAENARQNIESAQPAAEDTHATAYNTPAIAEATLPVAASTSAASPTDASPPPGQGNPGAPPRPKATPPIQYALMSAFIYPGAGQFARHQKGKAWVMIIFFTIFFVLWGILAVKGIISLYGGAFGVGGSPDDLELGVAYLKRSLIPGFVAALVFIHSAYDAYKG